MKFLKYLIGASALFLVQPSQAQLLVGPELGLTYSTMMATIDNNVYKNSFVGGARAGLTFDIEVEEKFYIQPAITASFLNGTKISHRSFQSAGAGVPTEIKDERSYRLYSVNIPIYFAHKIDFVYHPHTLVLGLGPVVNINYGGDYNRTYTTTINGLDRPVYDDRDINAGPNWGEHDIRLMEFGAAAMIGYEMTNGFNLRLHYGVSLRNMAPGGDRDTHFRTHGGGLSLSYYFNKPEQW